MAARVFISYSDCDKYKVDEITSSLEHIGVSYILNSNDAFPSCDISIWEEIAEQIRTSEIFLYVGSPSSFSNSYAFKKVHYAIDMVENRRDEGSTKGVITYLFVPPENMPDALRFLLSNVNHRTWNQRVFPDLIKDITKQLNLE